MIYRYQPQFFKIILIFLLLIFSNLILGFWWLSPYKSQLQQLFHENRLLEQKFQDQNALQKEFNNLKAQFSDLQRLGLADKQKMIKISNINQFYGQISQMSQSYQLKLIELKPQQHSLVANLQKQVFHLEITGAEKSIWLFLNSLSQYRGIIEFIQIEIMKTRSGINLQAILGVYYDAIA